MKSVKFHAHIAVKKRPLTETKNITNTLHFKRGQKKNNAEKFDGALYRHERALRLQLARAPRD